MKSLKEKADHAIIFEHETLGMMIKVVRENELPLVLSQLFSSDEASRVSEVLAGIGIPVYTEDKKGKREMFAK